MMRWDDWNTFPCELVPFSSMAQVHFWACWWMMISLKVSGRASVDFGSYSSVLFMSCFIEDWLSLANQFRKTRLVDVLIQTSVRQFRPPWNFTLVYAGLFSELLKVDSDWKGGVVSLFLPMSHLSVVLVSSGIVVTVVNGYTALALCRSWDQKRKPQTNHLFWTHTYSSKSGLFTIL